MKKPRNYCKNAASLCRKEKSKVHCRTLAKSCITPAARKRAGKKIKAYHAAARKLVKANPGMPYQKAYSQAAKKKK